jgi:hypothetical protein
MRIAVLVDDTNLRRNLHSAFRAAAGSAQAPTFLFSASWAELLASAREGACDLAIADPCISGRGGPASLDHSALDCLASALGRDRIVLFLSHPSTGPTVLQGLARAGFPYLILKGVDDEPRSLLRILARAGNRHALQSAVAPRELGEAGREGDRFLLEALTLWPPVSHADKLAVRFSLSRRTLERRLSEAEFPSPRRCISWARFLEASKLWGWGIGSRSRIASILGMSGPDALTHLCRGLTARPLREFWCAEPKEDAVQCLLAEIEDGRKSA